MPIVLPIVCQIVKTFRRLPIVCQSCCQSFANRSLYDMIMIQYPHPPIKHLKLPNLYVCKVVMGRMSNCQDFPSFANRFPIVLPIVCQSCCQSFANRSLYDMIMIQYPHPPIKHLKLPNLYVCKVVMGRMSNCQDFPSCANRLLR